MGKRVFIIYEVLKKENDLRYVKEYRNMREIADALKVANARQYLNESADNIKRLVRDKFAIIPLEIEED